MHFWLRDNLTDGERAAFLEGCRSLGQSPHASAVRVAVPAGTDREIVDNSYDVQLTVGFASPSDHDAYQSPGDAAHVAFVKRFESCWTRVLIYDSVLP